MRRSSQSVFVIHFGVCALGAHLLGACSQGQTERVDLDAVAKPTEIEELPVGPSENELLARDNAPTSEPVVPLDPELGFACDAVPEGRVIQRLNRYEYDNTVRDLLGDALLGGTTAPAREFPKDDFGDSFDNNAQALSVSPLLTETLLAAAERLARAALSEDNPRRDELVTCRADATGARNCAHQVLIPFLSRAFRRPLFDDEIERYVSLVLGARDEGASFEEGLALAIEAALASVHFLFRVELDVDPESEDFHALTQYELASRLSYFLWSSMPDEELFRAAREGELSEPEGLLAQVDRMLDDPKAEAMLHAFTGNWFEVNDISEINQPANELYPEFTPELKAAMEQETRLLSRDLLRGDLPLSQLLVTNETHVNAELAALYGLDGNYGAELERVSLAGTARGGLLTHASVLTLTSAPNRTSPVRRGVYVLSNLLCSPPPPPPPEVQGDLASASDEIPDDLPLAERARRHSEEPECAGCHTFIDPIGLGLEHFDAIGRHRTQEQGQPIDASGELVLNGERVAFSGASELGALLTQDPRLAQCAVRKLYTFASNLIPVGGADDCRLRWLEQQFRSTELDFRELIRTTVLTDVFRGRRGGVDADELEER